MDHSTQNLDGESALHGWLCRCFPSYILHTCTLLIGHERFASDSTGSIFLLGLPCYYTSSSPSEPRLNCHITYISASRTQTLPHQLLETFPFLFFFQPLAPRCTTGQNPRAGVIQANQQGGILYHRSTIFQGRRQTSTKTSSPA